jgi:transcription elongation factor Elf1
MSGRIQGKMELLVSKMNDQQYSPVLEDGFLFTHGCDRCHKQTLVKFMVGNKSNKDFIEACPCGYYNENHFDGASDVDDSWDDYDPDYDVPPGYMDDCPPDMDPDTWREYYTGG